MCDNHRHSSGSVAAVEEPKEKSLEDGTYEVTNASGETFCAKVVNGFISRLKGVTK